MQNGLHEHHCRKCGKTYECPKVTHCKESWQVAQCYLCYYEQYKESLKQTGAQTEG